MVLTLGLAVGALPWFGEEAITVAATAMVVLTTGFSSDDSVLLDRLGDTAIGIVVGLIVNAVVWPPLRRRTAISAMNRIDDSIGSLLADMGGRMVVGCHDDDVVDWVDRTRSLDDDIDHAWALVRQAQESGRMNPRRSARELRDPQRWRALLRRMEQAVADTRSMARTLGYHSASRDAWHPDFHERWPRRWSDAGEAIADADPRAIRRPGSDSTPWSTSSVRSASVGAVAGVRRPAHQPAQHPRRHGRGRRGQPARPAAATHCTAAAARLTRSCPAPSWRRRRG